MAVNSTSGVLSNVNWSRVGETIASLKGSDNKVISAVAKFVFSKWSLLLLGVCSTGLAVKRYYDKEQLYNTEVRPKIKEINAAIQLIKNISPESFKSTTLITEVQKVIDENVVNNKYMKEEITAIKKAIGIIKKRGFGCDKKPVDLDDKIVISFELPDCDLHKYPVKTMYTYLKPALLWPVIFAVVSFAGAAFVAHRS